MFKLNSKGDTIIEVMIALAILALAFSISYAISQSTLVDVQNSQEHSMALEYMDSQLEALQAVANEPNTPAGIPPSLPDNAFCLSTSGSSINAYDFTVNNYYNPSQTSVSNYPSKCVKSQGSYSYYVAIQKSPTLVDTYKVNIWWNGLGSLGVQQEDMYYRVYIQ